MVTYEWSDWRNGNIWWIQSVFVEKDFRNKGIFSLLYAFVKNRIRAETNVVGLRLYVEKNNLIGKAVYKRVGMTETNYLVYEEIK